MPKHVVTLAGATLEFAVTLSNFYVLGIAVDVYIIIVRQACVAGYFSLTAFRQQRQIPIVLELIWHFVVVSLAIILASIPAIKSTHFHFSNAGICHSR